ncbi:hypothetical protein [Bradyrhizobium sp. WD16]|uniref:hypothetical protein n=1 Tax=Bradyrhizobium sp. WD16 TaxID=1521768 RepID=UPI0020A5F08B|nr:hypothetical protein [Bradyrhizobium sp. WD16]UTD26187.1 hypothetical protein DB459_03870 [Bradyrhizobium sp. WD16]
MTLAADDLTEIERMLAAAGPGSNPLTPLRQRFPGLSWTSCDASEMIEEPYRSATRYDIHLVDRNDHCVQVTRDPERASGIVLAYRGAAA